jgi:hypothetical protein
MYRRDFAFALMEKSVQGEWSGLRSFPPYSTGNNHNTWYACNLVDADGRELPWVDRDGRVISKFSDRFRPAPGQRLYLKGGGEPNANVYEVQGPDTLPVDELLRQGYRLPFFADLTTFPEMERKVIWGMMVGEEGKTKIPVLKAYTDAGFDPNKDLIQSYGDGWKSGAFKSGELLRTGLKMVEDLRDREAQRLSARNPHELVRTLEVLNIMTNAELVMEACRVRKASSRDLEFTRLDYPDVDPPSWRRFVTIRQGDQAVETGSLDLDYYGSLAENYQRHNPDYRRGRGS